MSILPRVHIIVIIYLYLLFIFLYFNEKKNIFYEE